MGVQKRCQNGHNHKKLRNTVLDDVYGVEELAHTGVRWQCQDLKAGL